MTRKVVALWPHVSLIVVLLLLLLPTPTAAISRTVEVGGPVASWGLNQYGQLGYGPREPNNPHPPHPLPAQIAGLAGIVAVAGGYEHGLALKSDGTVWAWGRNIYGQLGLGTKNEGSDTPVQVQGLSGVTAIATGANHNLALKTDGTVWAWGYNSNGQLGDGTGGVLTDKSLPVQVVGGEAGGPVLSGIIALGAGESHSLALKSDGTIYSWGYGSYGQLGNGTTTYIQKTPVKVIGITGPTTNPTHRPLVAGGQFHSVAVKSDGTVAGWGYNYTGQVGNGTNSGLGAAGPTTPVTAQNLNGVVAVGAGGAYSTALKNDGTVAAWGERILNGTATETNTPGQVGGLTGITTLSGGFNHVLALKSDGTVLAWGRNTYGALGNGTIDPSATGVTVLGLTSARGVGAGNQFSLAIAVAGPPQTPTATATRTATPTTTFVATNTATAQPVTSTPTATLPASTVTPTPQPPTATWTATSVPSTWTATPQPPTPTWTPQPPTPTWTPEPPTPTATLAPVTATATATSDPPPTITFPVTPGCGCSGTILVQIIVTVSFDPGCVNQPVVITLSVTQSIASLAGLPSNAQALGLPFLLSTGSGGAMTFDRPVTLTARYTDADLAGLDESTLVLYRFDPTANAWHLLPSTVDAATNVVTAATTETGTFTLVGRPSGPPSPLGNLTLISPFRAVDTRASDGGAIIHIGVDQNGQPIPAAPMPAGATRRYRLSFAGSPVPPDATGVLLNVTAIGAAGGGYLTVFPGSDPAPPLASTLNPITDVAFNFWTVKTGPDALIGVFTTATEDVAIDVVGFYRPTNPSLGQLTLISPFRAVDTRASDGGAIVHSGVDQNGQPIPVGPVPGGQTRRYHLAFSGSPVPSNATGVLLNITLIGTPGGGYAVVFPGDDPTAPLASTLNPVTPIAFNFWTVKTGAGASIGFATTTTTDVAIDVVGYYAPTTGNTGALTLLSPFRTVDTRASDGGAIVHSGTDENGQPIPVGPVPGGTVRRYRMAVAGSPIPADASGVLLNVTLIGAAGGGYVIVFPGQDGTPPLASTLNPITPVAFNFWAVRDGPNAVIGVFTTATVDLAIDVVGYYR